MFAGNCLIDRVLITVVTPPTSSRHNRTRYDGHQTLVRQAAVSWNRGNPLTTYNDPNPAIDAADLSLVVEGIIVVSQRIRRFHTLVRQLPEVLLSQSCWCVCFRIYLSFRLAFLSIYLEFLVEEGNPRQCTAGL